MCGHSITMIARFWPFFTTYPFLFTFQIPYAQSTTSIATDPSISDRGADRVCGRFMNIKKAQTSSQTLCSKYKPTTAWIVKFVLNLVLLLLLLTYEMVHTVEFDLKINKYRVDNTKISLEK